MTALVIPSDDGSKCPIPGCRIHAANTEDANEIGYSAVLAPNRVRFVSAARCARNVSGSVQSSSWFRGVRRAM